jgi:hypothetical protein
MHAAFQGSMYTLDSFIEFYSAKFLPKGRSSKSHHREHEIGFSQFSSLHAFTMSGIESHENTRLGKIQDGLYDSYR